LTLTFAAHGSPLAHTLLSERQKNFTKRKKVISHSLLFKIPFCLT
jgi:hypothetical protein